MEKLVVVILAIGFFAALIALSVFVLTWILNMLLPLFGLVAAATYVHGLALFLLIGFFGSRVRSS